MAQKRVEEIFKQIAKKYNLPIYVIEEVFMSQYKKLKEEINSLEFKTIKLPSFGKFIASKKKLEMYDYEKMKQKRLDGTNKSN